MPGSTDAYMYGIAAAASGHLPYSAATCGHCAPHPPERYGQMPRPPIERELPLFAGTTPSHILEGME
eukprot:5578179-Pleurochrysis_carterae.AAC.1